MRVQINSDKNIAVSAELSESIQADVNRVLERFRAKLTRVEVHLSDVNSAKFGTRDKRCLVEARPAGHRPLSVSDGAATTELAVKSALIKMRSSLETFFGKLGRTERPKAKKKAVKAVAPSKRKATKKRTVAKKKALSPRGPKKKAIYQARRKRWPRH